MSFVLWSVVVVHSVDSTTFWTVVAHSCWTTLETFLTLRRKTIKAKNPCEGLERQDVVRNIWDLFTDLQIVKHRAESLHAPGNPNKLDVNDEYLVGRPNLVLM